MTLLRGLGFGKGAALGRAAVLGDQAGRPTLDADLLTQAEMNLRRGNEPFDLVFVAEEASRALLLPLPPGLNLVAVLAERPATLLHDAAVPVVCGLPGVRGAVAEGSLVLVDSARGRAIVDPSAQDIARVQGGNPRPRYTVGAAHVPARTQSGREVAVWAAAGTLSDLEVAEEGGADGLLIYPFGDLYPEADAALDAAFAHLLALADRWGNGDLGLVATTDSLDIITVCRLAAHCRLRWVLSPEELPLTPRELRAELKDVCRQEEELDGIVAVPRLVAQGSPADADGWDELIMDGEIAHRDPLEIFAFPPVYALLPEDLAALPGVVGAGVTGVIVPPQSVAAAKYAVREVE